MDFLLAILPILIVLVGMIFFNQSGSIMAILCWLLSFILAIFYFKTSFVVAISASVMGILKGLGVTLAVIFTMYLIFLMKEVGALGVIIDYVRRIARKKEEQVLFIGMGFGSLVTSLGLVTPAMFPPIFLMLGFTPVAAILISVLCYDPLTSFALFSIPITLPAKVAFESFKIHVPGIETLDAFIWDYTFKIAAFLPFISVFFAYLMLYVIDGFTALRKNFKEATICGLVLSLSALFVSWLKLIPVEVIGVFSGIVTMIVVHYLYAKNGDTTDRPILNLQLLKASSPFIILIVLSAVVNIAPIKKFLSGILGEYEVITVIGNQKADLDILSNVWFWILVTCILTIVMYRPSEEVLKKVTVTWMKRIISPAIAYSLFFSVAYIMAWSAMDVVDGKLVPTPYFKEYNMDRIIGITLANVFSNFYAFVAPILGVIGTFVGGSTTASNVLFAKIQYEATLATLGVDKFMWIYAAHAIGGGIASAITPSKITNAASTIGAGGEEESAVIRKVIIPVLGVSLVAGLLSVIFVFI